MLQSIIAIAAGIVLITQARRGTLTRWLLPFASIVGLIALIAGFTSNHIFLNMALLLAGLVLAMHTLYAVPRVGRGLKDMGLWLSRFRLPLGLANLVLGIGFLF